jgi:hypothetical protein
MCAENDEPNDSKQSPDASDGEDDDIENEDEDEDALEDAIDEALDAVLDAEMDDYDDSNDGEDDDDDDFDEEDEEADENNDEGDSAKEEETDAASKKINKRLLPWQLPIADSISTEAAERKRRKLEKESAKDTKGELSSTVPVPAGSAAIAGIEAAFTTPLHFSKVQTDLPEAELREKYPLFLQTRDKEYGAVDVVLTAGQMLYIPAGWFHEVRSKSAPGPGPGPGPVVGAGVGGGDSDSKNSSNSDNGSSCESRGREGHLALNYWFHPPDGSTFAKPYKSDFWKNDFEARKATEQYK